MSLLHSAQQPQSTPKKSSAFMFSLLLFGMVAMLFAFFPILQSTISIPKVFVLYGIGLIGVFVWLIQAMTSKVLRVRRTSLDMLVLVSIGAFLVSAIFSVIPQISFLGKMNVFVLHTAVYVAFAAWAWLCVQSITTVRRWSIFVYTFVFLGLLHIILFWLQQYITIPLISELNVTSIFSGSNSLFGLYIGMIAMLSLGLLLPKRTPVVATIWLAVTALVALASTIYLGFSSGILMLAIGAGLLIIVGITYLSEVRSSVVVATFAIFVGSVLLLLFGVPRFVTMQNTPVEVSIGSKASWRIVTSELLSGADSFLIGSGPGTFLQSFSEHREQAFNLNQIAWTVRFNTPYNTWYALLTELGVVGTIAFLVLVIGGLSITLSAWNKTRPSSKGDISVSTQVDMIRIQVFAVVAVWISCSIGMVFYYYGVTSWFVWWTLFALALTGIASFLPQVISERRWSLQVSPQYSLVLSFVLVLVATGIIVIGAFGTRIFLADVAYAQALRSTTIDETADYLSTTLRYRPNYVPYKLSQARLALQRARQEASSAEPNSDAIANYLALAVNTARQATNQQGADVETWETLASMYLNTQSLVPDANEWAQQSLTKALELEPTNPIFHWQKANAEAFAGNLEAAEESYKQSIRLKPDYIVAYVSLAALLESQERYDQAISLYQPIFGLIENNAEALFNLGRLFYNRQSEGDLERAETVLVRAIELNENYANARFTLGLVYEAQGKPTAAREQYEIIGELNPDNETIQQKLRSVGIAPVASTETNTSESTDTTQ